MKKSTKRVVLRFIFWAAVIAAPVVFFSMGLVYLNAYITEDRVNFVVIPVFETLSSRTVQIESTGAHIGLTSWFEFRNIRFYPQSTQRNAAYTPADTYIDRIYLQFKPFTLFARTFKIDSVLIDGFSGILNYDPERQYMHYEWHDNDETRTLRVDFDLSDLENIHIKSLIIRNADVRYFHRGLNLEYYIEGFFNDMEVEGFRVMNMMLVNGRAGGVLRDPETGERYTDVALTGRLQLNLDDGTFILRGGRMTIDGDDFSFIAHLQKDGDIPHLSIYIDEPRETIEEIFRKLPSSIEQWLQGELPGSRYRVTINFPDDHAANQT